MSHGNPNSPTKICATIGCERFVRARGLCVTHYNQTRPNRHEKTMTGCVVCSKQILRRTASRRQPTCSTTCRAIVQFGAQAGLGTYDWAVDAMRRATLAGAIVVDHIEREEVFARDGHHCYLCECEVTEPSPFDLRSATVDHIIALSNGGQHTMDNVATACLLCNSRKQDASAPLTPATLLSASSAA